MVFEDFIKKAKICRGLISDLPWNYADKISSAALWRS